MQPVSAAERVKGEVITEYGAYFDVRASEAIPEGTVFRLAWDVKTTGNPDEVIVGFNTIARFLNMHHAAGVPAENMDLVLVVHGAAAAGLLKSSAYTERTGVTNPNEPLIRDLMNAGVEVILCGQSSASRNVPIPDLIEGVRVELSAMTAHSRLQQQGYALNPF